MKKQTKKLLTRVGAVTAAIAVTLGAAWYSTKKILPAVPASVDSSERRVMILDAGHGGWA